MKKLISFLLFSVMSLCSSLAHAQSNVATCPNIQTQYHINFDIQPLQYDNVHTSSQLPEKDPGSLPLGLFTTAKKLALTPSYSILKTSSSNQICAKVSEVSFYYYYLPTIYITTETLDLACTYNRTLNHENTHYKNSIRGMQALQENIQNILMSEFDNYIYANTEQEIKAKLQLKVNNVEQLVQTIYNNATIPYDQLLDNAQNYQYETNLCSAAENNLVIQRIQYDSQ